MRIRCCTESKPLSGGNSVVVVAILADALDSGQQLCARNAVPLQHLGNSDRWWCPPDGSYAERRELANVGSTQPVCWPVDYFVVLALDNTHSTWRYFADAQCWQFVAVIELVVATAPVRASSISIAAIGYSLLAKYLIGHLACVVATEMEENDEMKQQLANNLESSLSGE